jgi:GNAT superfamily N-acetyltransferase
LQLKANIPSMAGQWETLSEVFPHTGEPGIAHQRQVHGELGPHAVTESLLYYNESGNLVGVLNYYPNDVPAPAGHVLQILEDPSRRFIERAGNFVVIVHPEHQRTGVGTKLLREAVKRWPINFEQQDYTWAGANLIKKFLSGE